VAGGDVEPSGGPPVNRGAAEPPTTPWRHGRLDGRRLRPRLAFGRAYEDPAVEHAHLPPEGRVVAVASAGDVAVALARTGRRVTAVDCNPAQLAYLERRLRGAPTEAGEAERLLGLARAALRPAGWHPALLDAFCQLDDPGAQVRLWRSCAPVASSPTARWPAPRPCWPTRSTSPASTTAGTVACASRLAPRDRRPLTAGERQGRSIGMTTSSTTETT
jgi:hypothetical protein